MWVSNLKEEIKKELEERPIVEVWNDVLNKVLIAFEEAAHEASEEQLKRIL